MATDWNAVEEPQKITDKPETQVWFKQNVAFKCPYGVVRCMLKSPDNGFGDKQDGLIFVHVWARVLTQYQKELVYNYSKAGIFMNYEVQSNNVQFTWKGYNDCLPEFVESSMKNIVEMREEQPNQLEHLFEGAKSYLTKKWK